MPKLTNFAHSLVDAGGGCPKNEFEIEELDHNLGNFTVGFSCIPLFAVKNETAFFLCFGDKKDGSKISPQWPNKHL